MASCLGLVAVVLKYGMLNMVMVCNIYYEYYYVSCFITFIISVKFFSHSLPLTLQTIYRAHMITWSRCLVENKQG